MMMEIEAEQQYTKWIKRGLTFLQITELIEELNNLHKGSQLPKIVLDTPDKT